MRVKQLVGTAIAMISLLVLASPALAGDTDVLVNPDGEQPAVDITATQLGETVKGPGAPAWLLKCSWSKTTRAGVDHAYASYHGTAVMTPEHFRDLGLDPDEEFAIVKCPLTADVLAVAPSIRLTGYLGAWPLGGSPPQLILDWLVASARAQVDIPVQIGSSAPTGADTPNAWITQLDSWLWVDPSVWQPVSHTSAPVFGITVTVTATPYEVTFEDDDGHFINCGDNVGRVWHDSIPSATTTRCSITPEHTSHTGDRWLRSTVYWQVDYVCSNHCGGGRLGDFVIANTRPIVTQEYLVVES